MTAPRLSLHLLGGAALAAALLAGHASRDYAAEESGPASDASDAALVALGKKVYQAQCAACHGVNLEGQPYWRKRKPDGRLPAPPQNASGHTWHHPDAVLFTITKYGPQAVAGPNYASDMPAFAEILSDREIAAALAYIKSTWPPSIRRRHDMMNRMGRPHMR